MPLGALVAAAMPLIGQGLEFIGNERTNAANARQAAANRDFQERMSNTSYQRAVADMRAAGLNPALAYQQGGATAPTGASANFQNSLQGAGNNARAAAQTYQDARTAQAQRESIEAQTDLTRANAQQLRLESALKVAELQAGVNLKVANAHQMNTMTPVMRENMNVNTKLADSRFYQTEEQTRQLVQTFGVRQEMLKAQLRNMLTNASETEINILAKKLALPALANDARAQGSYFKRNISPYLNDAQAVKNLMPSLRDILLGKALIKDEFGKNP